jgi:pyruvate ferredoxin oxidoreductase alpha subunit
VVDTILIAYRLAEHPRVRLPAIVNLDGFYLSFTREPVELPQPEAARRFLPPFEAGPIAFRASRPISQACAVLGGSAYSYFRYQTHLAATEALQAYEEIAAAFETEFGRRHAMVDDYRCDDAEFVFVMIGAFATKAMEAVDRLREEGWKIGLVRPRLLRPWPAQALRRLLLGRRAAVVVDQNLSMGFGGVLHAEIASALYGCRDAPPLLGFVGGLGGRDIPSEEFFEMARLARDAAATGTLPAPRLLYSEAELREVRKLQTIAAAGRPEGGTS